MSACRVCLTSWMDRNAAFFFDASLPSGCVARLGIIAACHGGGGGGCGIVGLLFQVVSC